MKSAAQRLRSLATQMWRSNSRTSSEEWRVLPPICDDVQIWCAAHREGECDVISPPRVILRHPPRTIEPLVQPSFESLQRVEAPPRTLVRVEGARLVGSNGLVVLPDGSFVGEMVALTAPGHRTMLETQPAYRRPLPRKVKRKPGNYYPLIGIGWENYYHWNHDIIMRVSCILGHLPSDIRFVVPPRLKPFQHETLGMLGIESERLDTFNGEEVWDCESLFFSTPILKTQIDTPEPLEWFKEATFARYQISPDKQQRRVYLSRRPDGHYRTVNEPEVETLLGANGFETVLPGTMSLRDQAALFAEADIVVGTGTGLANMVFMPKGARILQFQEPSLPIHALWTMAEALGHRYWYLMGTTVPNRDGLSSEIPGGTRPDIFVPLDKLEQALDAVLSDTLRESQH